MERYTSQINNKAIAAIISRQIKRNCSLHVWPCISKNYLALARHVPSTRWSLPGSRAEPCWGGMSRHRGAGGCFSTAGRDSSAGPRRAAPRPGPGVGMGTGPRMGLATPVLPRRPSPSSSRGAAKAGSAGVPGPRLFPLRRRGADQSGADPPAR